MARRKVRRATRRVARKTSFKAGKKFPIIPGLVLLASILWTLEAFGVMLVALPWFQIVVLLAAYDWFMKARK